MTHAKNKRDLRQYAYRERAIRAKTYARVLMPVVLFAVGTSVWTDPLLGPKVTQGIQDMRPIAASYLADTPLEDVLERLPAEDAPQQEASGGQRVTASADLRADQP